MKVIWNLTRICSWHCLICCVAALDVKPKLFTELHNHLVASGQELSFSQKIRVLDDLFDSGISDIDFSGGDLLLDPDNIEVIKYAGRKFGKDRISISIPGNGLTKDLIRTLMPYVSKMEFTLDSVKYDVDGSRPSGYVEAAKHAISLCNDMNMKTTVSTILKESNSQIDNLKKIYEFLLEHKVAEWEILKYYQVGRAQNIYSLNPSTNTFAQAIDYINSLMAEKQIDISYQHSLENQFTNCVKCNAIVKSIGIMPNGMVLACAWGLNACGEPIDEDMVLGKMPEQKLKEILESMKAKCWLQNKYKNGAIVCQVQQMLENYVYQC